MPSLHNRLDWKVLAWWVAVLGVALAIKYHYSIATAADLDWMLRPLSLLLEWSSGHPFHRNNLYEWVSESADVRLVKGCAGINFLLMSLLAWAWVFAPERREDVDTPTWIARRVLLRRQAEPSRTTVRHHRGDRRARSPRARQRCRVRRCRRRAG